MSTNVTVSDLGHRAALITINRPDVLNALDETTVAELSAVIDDVNRASPSKIQTVVLTGAGSRAFIAGGDIRRMAEMDVEDGRRYRLVGHALLRMIEDSAKIYVAAINGYALGGGLELALACDLRVAVRSAELGLPELGVGLIPAWGGMQRLTRLVGAGVAKEIVLLGRRLSADEAQRLGIVNEVVEPDSLMRACMRIARVISGKGAIALRQAKRSINIGCEMTLDHALAFDVESASVNFATRDRIEGLRAFMEKRPPVFEGR